MCKEPPQIVPSVTPTDRINVHASIEHLDTLHVRMLRRSDGVDDIQTVV